VQGQVLKVLFPARNWQGQGEKFLKLGIAFTFVGMRGKAPPALSFLIPHAKSRFALFLPYCVHVNDGIV
jgi:hypothetical protein